jgi:hypothetical protein
MAIANLEDALSSPRTRRHPHARKARELSALSSLGICLLAAILLAATGRVAIGILLTLVTLD